MLNPHQAEPEKLSKVTAETGRTIKHHCTTNSNKTPCFTARLGWSLPWPAAPQLYARSQGDHRKKGLRSYKTLPSSHGLLHKNAMLQHEARLPEVSCKGRDADLGGRESLFSAVEDCEETVESPTLEIFKTHLDKVLYSLL